MAFVICLTYVCLCGILTTTQYFTLFFAFLNHATMIHQSTNTVYMLRLPEPLPSPFPLPSLFASVRPSSLPSYLPFSLPSFLASFTLGSFLCPAPPSYSRRWQDLLQLPPPPFVSDGPVDLLRIVHRRILQAGIVVAGRLHRVAGTKRWQHCVGVNMSLLLPLLPALVVFHGFVRVGIGIVTAS